MISEYKVIIDDLLDYTVNGIHLGQTALGFDGVSYDSTVINTMKYQFIRKYEQVNTITDSKIIPVLIVTQPEQYLKGRILYNAKFVDLRTLLIKEEDGAGVKIKKINFFVIPQLAGLIGGNLGRITYDLKIDYVTEVDTYGFMSKEIDSILKRHYFRPSYGQYH